MKTRLMHADRDFEPRADLPPHGEALIADLELDTLLVAMAGGDDLVGEVAKATILWGLADPDAITYRQDVLRDCLAHPAVVRELYGLAVEALQRERKASLGGFSRSPDLILHRAVRVLADFVAVLKRLRELADAHADEFHSAGFVALFDTLRTELDDDYLATVDEHLRRLRFRHGVLMSAQLGRGNTGTGYVLRKAHTRGWRDRIAIGRRSSYSFEIPDRDEAGAEALGELRINGINLVANALAQSTDHVLGFFRLLRSELAFHVGCLNLHERLADHGEPTCFPAPVGPGEPALSCAGLYDPSLSLNAGKAVVGNDVDADGRALVMVTGANQGGKSTFLRSVGLAQLMLQCGMFVAADAFRADVRDGVFTHFKREEDATMERGKLDEELARMSDIVDELGPNGLVLCNESFASTNEREGSELARQIIRALLEPGVKVVFVTHMFDLAHGLHAERGDDALFLRAEREADGRRTFRVVEGEPLPTSYGADLYERIFGASPDAATAAS